MKQKLIRETNGGAPVQPFHVRNVKLDFPRFDGTNLLQWNFKAEQFFNYYNTPDAQRLTIAAVHLDKDVIPWYQMMTRTNTFHSWVDLTRALEIEFGPSPYECPRSHLFKLTQAGRDVIAQAPTTLIRSVLLAKLYEEKYIPNHKPYQTSLPLSQTLRTTSSPPLLPTPNQSSLVNTIKKISPAEMQLRREKGLCYTCDEKFSSSHRCPNKQYLLLQLEQDDINEPEPDPPDILGANSTLSLQQPHLSYNALKGSSCLGTMKFLLIVKEGTVCWDIYDWKRTSHHMYNTIPSPFLIASLQEKSS
uniref:Retrotransposon gag domain-containing protein n=1 Tax=Cajanus cajan TaxID=3821 RepID=A0A151RV12_CAJCA|nr:hypothetical protein KK1_032020 [Cajanus cajan]